MLLNPYGVFYYVGDNYILPTYLEMNNGLTGGHEVYITVQKLVKRNLPKPYNDCVNDLSPELYNSVYFNNTIKNGHQYRQNNCFEHCMLFKVGHTCNCISVGNHP